MRRFAWSGLICVLLCHAQQRDRGGAAERGITDGILAREARDVKRQYDVASLHSDGNWFRRVLAEDYVWYGPNGEVVNKDTYIQELLSRAIVWDSVAVKDVVVRVYGNTAVATGRFFGKGKYKGSLLDERQRFTSVLIKREGQWFIVAEHCSKLAPADQ